MALPAGVSSAPAFMRSLQQPPHARAKSPIQEIDDSELTIPVDPDTRAREVARVMAKMSDPELHIVLNEMPKGADLHVLLEGSAYPEDLLYEAKNSMLFCDQNSLLFSPKQHPGAFPVSAMVSNPETYARLLNNLTLRACDSNSVKTYHHYLQRVAPSHKSLMENIDPFHMVNCVWRQGQIQNLAYMEMLVSLKCLETLAKDFDRIDLLNPVVRFIVAVDRTKDNSEVNAELAMGFSMLNKYPRYIVGINLIGPEDNESSRDLFDIQIGAINSLVTKDDSKGCNVIIQAGKLTPDIAIPAMLIGRIKAGAGLPFCKRVSNAVSILWEHDAKKQLRKMSVDRIAVELCLSVQDKMLGLKGSGHPALLYKKSNVPIVLCTEMEGVTREGLSKQYFKAMREIGFTYEVIKAINRNGLEYSLLPGESIFEPRADRYVLKAAFKGVDMQQWTETQESYAIKTLSPKAALQVKLERMLVKFEVDLLNNA